nr:EAL domain-containing protein [Motiliproteus sp. SC1-56]
MLVLGWLWNQRLQREVEVRARTERSLRESEQRLERAQAIAHIGDWERDLETDEIRFSDEVFRILGYPPQAFTPNERKMSELVHPEDIRRVMRDHWRNPHEPQSSSRTEFRIRRPDGEERSLLAIAELELDAAGRPSRLVGTLQDVTELQAAYERLGLAREVIENVAEGILIADAEKVILDANPAYQKMTGFSREELVGKSVPKSKSGYHDRAFYARMWEAIEQQGQWQGEIWNRHKSGEVYPSWLTINAIREPAGAVTHYVGLFRDLSAQKSVEAKLERMALYDAVTGLPNRTLFHQRLDQELRRAGRRGGTLAVFWLDLDRFKLVNDSLGPEAGDRVLQEMAERLGRAVRRSDTVARMGGDEFSLIMPGVGGLEGLAQQADALLCQIKEPVCVDGEELFLGASLGLATYPDDGAEASELIKAANAAMYRAKAEGGDQYAFFDDALNSSETEPLVLERELRYALSRDEFCLYYQPKVDLDSGRLIGVEALVRWHHPQRGVISPAEFIPLAEATGLIVPLGEWILLTACRQAARWRSRPGGALPVAVNLSARQFSRQQALLELVRSALKESALEPGMLELELTESMVMGDVSTAIETMHALRKLGARLAIDDFGTGYSSLEYLKRFPIDTLKIDQSFVRELDADSNDAAIVQAVIALAKSMALNVVAEGVETEHQRRFLTEHGCRSGQGYLFARPLLPEQLEQTALFREVVAGARAQEVERPAKRRVGQPSH